MGWLSERASFVPVAWQDLDLSSLDLTTSDVCTSVWLRHQDQTVAHGAEAIALLLTLSTSPFWRTFGRLLLQPGVRVLAHGVYRIVADNRAHMPGGTGSCTVNALLSSGDRPPAL